MRLLGKHITQIIEDDIRRLIDNQVSESITLDYKLSLPGNSDGDKKEFLADVSSFANTLGGVIAYGIVEQKDQAGHNTGIPEKVEGVAPTNFDQVKLRLESILRDGLEPRLPSVSFQAIDLQGKVVFLVGVSRSLLAPHIVWYQRDGKFYRRNNSGKHQMNIHEIRQAFLETEQLGYQAEQFRNERAGIIRERLKMAQPASNDSSAFIVHIVPLGFGRIRLDLSSRYQWLGTFMMPPQVGGWDFRPNFDGYLVYYNQNPSYNWHIQYFRNGAVEIARFFPNEGSVPGVMIQKECAGYVQKVRDYYRTLDIEPPFAVFLTVFGVKNTPIATPNMSMGPIHNSIDRPDLFLPYTLFEDLDTDMVPLMQPMFDAFWQSAGWAKAPNLQ